MNAFIAIPRGTAVTEYWDRSKTRAWPQDDVVYATTMDHRTLGPLYVFHTPIRGETVEFMIPQADAQVVERVQLGQPHPLAVQQLINDAALDDPGEENEP